MEVLKRYDRVSFDKRFGLYKRFALVYYILFFASVLVGAVVSSGTLLTDTGSEAFDRFLGLFSQNGADLMSSTFSNILVLLGEVSLVFVFGITVYAPFVGGFTAILRGAEFGCALRFYCELMLYTDRVIPFAADCVFYFVSGILLTLYASFVSCVAFNLFSAAEKEGDMFGGSLFYSSFFKQRVNLRFLSMYISAYALMVSFSFLMAYLKAKVFILA